MGRFNWTLELEFNMMVLFGLIDILIIGLFVFLIMKFWILKIPEVRLLLSSLHIINTNKLAKKKLTLSEQIDKDTEDMVKELDKDMEETRKKRRTSKRKVNTYLKEDL